MTKHVLISFAAATLFLAPAAFGQDPQPADTTVTGVVVSSSPNTMVVKPENGREVLVLMERDTRRPRAIPVGTTVRVVSRADDEGLQVARSVNVTSPAPTAGAAAQTDRPADTIPPEIRKLERQIERQARRYRAGFRVGMGLDPEIVTVGVQAKLGPIFHPNVSFRPNIEFGFGEVTTLVAINLDAVYRMPISSPQGKVNVYLGAGPGLNFIHRNFEQAIDGDRDIDFGDLSFDPSLNLVAGMEFRNGMFTELRSSAYGQPRIRFTLGFNF